ncbi:3-deoxy-D-manno-octulosonic acid transferase [Mucilaginibacter sp. L196]|uniref:3-deoxy-D-manno-octulosonic acid transferase n=1 Tax=Mucilaginibacter sp. L196 TaxID=1641870 RepID=UPI001575A300|nr:glycosyltransferase N-terminal domain-containing protein [Mucilaginibacter sp. L196]
MLLIYNIGISLYFCAIYVASFFNKKAKLWLTGRNNVVYKKFEKSLWFHFASLGEFEQGRPLLEHARKNQPETKIVVTFFSPSGYEIRKNTPLADTVYYLPLDTASNAREFIEAINPEAAIFTKYEYWYHYFNELHKREIPLYVISGIFRPEQVFFKWYGGLHRKMLGFVTYFFVQDTTSKELLQTLGVSNVEVSGDTRFDRVWANAQHPTELPVINQFKNDHKLFIAGSTWPDDEALVATLVKDYADWKFIFAPHEIGEDKIEKLISLLPLNSVIRHSQIAVKAPPNPPQKGGLLITTDTKVSPTGGALERAYQTLIIDNIGMLSSLYQYADVAFIGGGFGVGIHNTLEAAAFGLPVIFGPNYDKFKEAKDLISIKGGYSINDEPELKATVAYITEDIQRYNETCREVKDYVMQNTGATKTIADHIHL